MVCFLKIKYVQNVIRKDWCTVVKISIERYHRKIDICPELQRGQVV